MNRNKRFLVCMAVAICAILIVLLVQNRENTSTKELSLDKYIQKTTDDVNDNLEKNDAESTIEPYVEADKDTEKMVTMEDISSIEDFTDERLLSGNIFFKGVLYGSLIDGNTLTKNMGYFSGCDYDQVIEAKEETKVDFSILTDLTEEVIKVSVISKDKIQHISLEGDSITIPKGQSIVVISGYHAEGNLEIVIHNGNVKWIDNPDGIS